MQENGLKRLSSPQPKVVGPNVKGKREEYQLIRRLQSALFGGVYEATGRSSGKDYAIKVLHKSELAKAQECKSIDFCEAPLSEIRFAELMRGDEHVMEPEEHFEDQYCWYVVFELARGGDLLEALKQKPRGFDEAQAQCLIRQAAKGLAFLHRRRIAMQDVSLENMLLHVNDQTGHYQVKICDPGQAVIFEVDTHGEEKLVNFRGLVGKSFRPPELHDQSPYVATKVDSWCLGWSTFYLLTAQPLFMSADPANQDADWLLFQQGDLTTLFKQKSNLCSATALNFIFRLLQIEPNRRMSVSDALNHPWLADPIAPVMAAEELLPESVRKGKWEQESTPVQDSESLKPSPSSKTVSGATAAPSTGSANLSMPGMTQGSTLSSWSGSGSNVLPTWSATTTVHNGSGQSPLLRVRSPLRSTRLSHNPALQPRMPTDSRRPKGAGHGRATYIATAHSPPPCAYQSVPQRTAATRTASPIQASMAQPARMRAASPTQQEASMAQPARMRAASPVQQEASMAQPARMRAASPVQQKSGAPLDPTQASMAQPARMRAASPTQQKSGAPLDPTQSSVVQPAGMAQPAMIRAASPTQQKSGAPLDPTQPSVVQPAMVRASSPSQLVSPTPLDPTQPGVVKPALVRPSSPTQHLSPTPLDPHALYRDTRSRPEQGLRPAELAPGSCSSPLMRTASPAAHNVGATTRTASPGIVVGRASEGVGFSWSQAPPTFSPRGVSPVTMAFPRQASPGASGAMKPGFAWSPDPPSPRVSPRTSPGPTRLGRCGAGARV